MLKGACRKQRLPTENHTRDPSVGSDVCTCGAAVHRQRTRHSGLLGGCFLPELQQRRQRSLLTPSTTNVQTFKENNSERLKQLTLLLVSIFSYYRLDWLRLCFMRQTNSCARLVGGYGFLIGPTGRLAGLRRLHKLEMCFFFHQWFSNGWSESVGPKSNLPRNWSQPCTVLVTHAAKPLFYFETPNDRATSQ